MDVFFDWRWWLTGKNIILFGIKSKLIYKKKNLIAMPVYNKIILKTEIKSSGDEFTYFYGKEFPRVDSNHTYLTLISLDSALKKEGNCYPQSF